MAKTPRPVRTKRAATKTKTRSKQHRASQPPLLTSERYPQADAAEDLVADVAHLSEWGERIERRLKWLRPRYRPAEELREKERPVEQWLAATGKSGQRRVAEYFGQEPKLRDALGRLLLVFPDEIRSIDWGINWVNASTNSAHESPTDDAEILPTIDSLEELAAQIKSAVKSISSQLIDSEEPTKPTPPTIVDVIEKFWLNIRQLQILLRAEQAKLTVPRPEYVSQKATELRNDFLAASNVFRDWETRFAGLSPSSVEFFGEAATSHASMIFKLTLQSLNTLESRRQSLEEPRQYITTNSLPFCFSATDVETLRQWFDTQEPFQFSGSPNEQVAEIHKRFGKLLVEFRKECARLDPLGKSIPKGQENLPLGPKAWSAQAQERYKAIRQQYDLKRGEWQNLDEDQIRRALAREFNCSKKTIGNALDATEPTATTRS